MTPARLELLGELMDEYRAEHGYYPSRTAVHTRLRIEREQLLAEMSDGEPWAWAPESYDEAGR